MFEIKIVQDGLIQLSGRFDAAQVEKAKEIFDPLTKSQVLDCKELAYISSAGLSVLIATYKRLEEHGGNIKLINLNDHIIEIFRLTGLDKIFEI